MSNQLDSRELQERLEELESLQADYDLAKENFEETQSALDGYREHDAKNDSDVESEEKILELEEEVENAKEEMEKAELDTDDAKELEELQNLKEEIGGEWKYGVQLIPEDDFEAYCQELCEDIGDIPKDLPSYIVIDWKATTDNIRQDYTETEFRGETYLYRV